VVNGKESKFTGRFDPEQGTNLLPHAALQSALKPGVATSFDKEKKTVTILVPK
jgi:hypothetical protein